MDKISIILAIYNGELFLREQLDSIANQTLKPSEIIIVDDASTDNSIDIVNNWKKRIDVPCKILKNEKNMGACRSFERGLELASGDYISFSDQDDIWKEDKNSKLFNKMKEIEFKYGDIPILVHSDLEVVMENVKTISESLLDYEGINHIESKDKYKTVLVHNFVTGCAMMINKKARDYSLPFSGKIIMHDWWIALVVATLGEIGFVDEPLIKYRQHANNVYGARSYLSFKGLCGAIDIRKRLKRIDEIINQTSFLVERIKLVCGNSSKLYKELISIFYCMCKGDVYALWKYNVKQQGAFRTGLLYILLLLRSFGVFKN